MPWLRDHIPEPATLRADAIAGLTTAVMLIPQGMAYAMLAGLPAIVGLYAAIVPLIAYAIAGGSKQLAVGPVAMDSLLTAAAVGAIAESGTTEYAQAAALLALLAGVVQLGLGLVRGGVLVNFLSRPVISGFTSAAAFIIAMSQLRLVLGLDLPRTTSVFEVAAAVVHNIAQVHLPTVALAGGSMVALGAMKRWAPKWPRALIVVAVGSGVAAAFNDALGLALVGSVPAGLPMPQLPDMSLDTIRELTTGAVTIAVIGFMEGISISTRLADEDGERLSADRELVALGLANIGAGLFRGYPVAGGFSRTAVNAEAGAKTKLAGFITAAIVAITVAFFTGVLAFVPKATLGAIIVMAVVGLVDLDEPRRLWTVHRPDLAMLVVTFAATLVLGIQYGVGVGVGLSVLSVLLRTTRPHTAVLGRLPGTELYRNVERFPDAITTPGVIAVRPDAQLYFGNTSALRDTLARLERACPTPLRAVIIDASGINQLDSTGERALRDLHADYARRDIALTLASVKGPVRDVLDRSGLRDVLGPAGVADSIHDAVVAVKAVEAAAAEPPAS